MVERKAVEVFENGKLKIIGKRPAVVETRETRAEVMTVLNEEEFAFENLKKLKATVDAVKEGPRLLFAIGKLVSTAYEDELLSVETFEKLGFTPAVSRVLVDIAHEKATVVDLDAVWDK